VKLPGLAAEMCGIEVEEYVSIPEYENNQINFTPHNFEKEFPVTIWADVLETKGAEPIAIYQGDFYAGKPAATLNEFGDGKVIYLGALGEKEYYHAVASWLVELVGIKPMLAAPLGIEVAERWQGDRRLLFILNHTKQEQTILLEGDYKNLLDDGAAKGNLQLPPLDVVILAEEG
jgi:beta-galactosidase